LENEDMIYLNIFDEVLIDLINDDRERGKKVHQKYERVWIGSLKIPFSNLYKNSIIQGKFKVHTPDFLLGYYRDYSRETHIHIYLSALPSLVSCGTVAPREEESPAVCRIINSIPDIYKMNIFAVNLLGKACLLLRYIRPQSPPSVCSEINQMLRYVSRIPVLTNIQKNYVWATSQVRKKVFT
jgi:coiled-coil and C2 domain-containing protein 2A